MKATLLGVLLATVAGCAHGTTGYGQAADLRGSAQLSSGPRLLVVGPVASVHTSAQEDKTVALYLVDKKADNDGDCHAVGSSTATRVASHEHYIQVPTGRALCAVAATTLAADVQWHAHVESSEEMWARK